MDAGISKKNSKGPVNAFLTAVAGQIRAIAHQNEFARQKELAPQNKSKKLISHEKKTAIKAAFYGFAALVLYRRR